MKIAFTIIAWAAICYPSVLPGEHSAYNYLLNVASNGSLTESVFTKNSVKVLFYCDCPYLNGLPVKNSTINCQGDIGEGQDQSPADGSIESRWNDPIHTVRL